MSKKHKLDASHPGVGKSKIMKKLAKKLKRKYVDVPVQKEWMRHLDAFAALAGSMPKPSDARFSGMNTKQVYDILVLDDVKTEPVQPQPIHICSGNRPEDGVGEALRRFIHTKPTMPELASASDIDAFVTFWDGQLDDMERAANARYDRLLDAIDSEGSGQMMALICRIIAVRRQLDTMKKEQDQ
jgi:hypothetical protein